MPHQQTIDLRDDLDAQLREQQTLLARMHEISDRHAARPWSDEHDLQALMMRYEETAGWRPRAHSTIRKQVS